MKTKNSLLILALVLGAAPSAALAQEPTEAAREEASERFRRALELFDEERYEDALIEFTAAYELVPSYQVLYNIGNVHAELGHPVEAVDAWARYLAQGGEAIDAARRSEVQASLERQRTRIGTVTVRSNVEGATVTIDGVAVAETPLDEPLRLAIGSYAIGVEAAGYQGPTRRVTVSGESAQTVDFGLERTSREVGEVRIASTQPGIEIRVDGESVGTTPMSETIPLEPGSHTIEGRRRGYTSFRQTVEVEHGQETTVHLSLTVDPAAPPSALGRVRLRLPDAPYTVRVDGAEQAFSGGSAELPVGPHVVLVEVDEREPVRESIEVTATEPLTMDVNLRWTPEARQRRRDKAGTRRLIGIVLTIGGVAVAGASAGILGWNEIRAGRLDELRPSYLTCTDGGAECDLETEAEAQEYLDLDRAVSLTRGLAVGGVAAGAVLLAVGLGLWLTAPSDEEIEREAGLSLTPMVGPGSVGLAGRF